MELAAAAAVAACDPRALPFVALALLAWFEDRVAGVARAALPLALALAGAWGLGAIGLPGAPLAGAGALAAFALAAYGRRGLAGALLLAACAAGQVAAGEGPGLAAGAGAGGVLGVAAWTAAVRLFPEGHLASRRRARRLDRRAKLA